MTKYIFEFVSTPLTFRYTCKGCGKRRTKTLRAEQSLNPYNKNAEGFPKSTLEIQAENRVKLKEMKAAFQGFCTKCE